MELTREPQGGKGVWSLPKGWGACSVWTGELAVFEPFLVPIYRPLAFKGQEAVGAPPATPLCPTPHTESWGREEWRKSGVGCLTRRSTGYSLLGDGCLLLHHPLVVAAGGAPSGSPQSPHQIPGLPGPPCLVLRPLPIQPWGPAQPRGPALPGPLHCTLSLSLASLWLRRWLPPLLAPTTPLLPQVVGDLSMKGVLGAGVGHGRCSTTQSLSPQGMRVEEASG